MILLGRRIIVELLPKEKSTIVLLDEKENNYVRNVGIVKYVGQGTQLADGSFVPLITKVGDKVLFGQYSGKEIELEDGKEYIELFEENIICILNRDNV